MRVRLNPKRTALVLAVAVAWMLWRKLQGFSGIPFPDSLFNGLDQKHRIAAWAMLLLALVGIVKLITRDSSRF